MAANISETPGPASPTGSAQFQEVPLAEVDLEDQAFVVPSADDLSGLTASIREVGLLAPPCLRRRADGRWQVVAGLKRLLAAARLGWEQVPARTLPEAVPDCRCLLVALYDNSFTRGFNLWEQAFFAARLLVYWDAPTVAAAYLPCLGLPPSPAFLARLQALATLEPPWRKLAARGRLALTAGAALARWTPADRAAALPYMENLWLSQSKQEQFVAEVALLARREGVRPGEVLARPELGEILLAPAPSPQERTAAVRRRLRTWVYPRLAAAEEAFQAGLSAVGLSHHPRLQLKPPPAFEGPDFHLEVKFRDAPELQSLLTELARLAQQEEFSALTRV
jgi:hypothetical protein